MNKKLVIYMIITLVVATSGFIPKAAWAGPGSMAGNGPYGGYCQGPRWGWYGARTPVTTMESARTHLEKFYEGKKVTIGTITDQGMFFKAEIKNQDNAVIDYVIINKRNGRIRSIL